MWPQWTIYKHICMCSLCFTWPVGGVCERVCGPGCCVLVNWHSLCRVHSSFERGGLEDPGVVIEGGLVAASLSVWEICAVSPQCSEAQRIPAVLQENRQAQAPAITYTLCRYTHTASPSPLCLKTQWSIFLNAQQNWIPPKKLLLRK